MTEELTSQKGQQLEITEVNGKTTIVFRKAVLKGKVNQNEVLNTILIAAKLQAEYYIKKLSQGAGLDTTEIKALRDLAEITKLESKQEDIPKRLETVTIDEIKSNLYTRLAEKMKGE